MHRHQQRLRLWQAPLSVLESVCWHLDWAAHLSTHAMPSQHAPNMDWPRDELSQDALDVPRLLEDCALNTQGVGCMTQQLIACENALIVSKASSVEST